MLLASYVGKCGREEGKTREEEANGEDD